VIRFAGEVDHSDVGSTVTVIGLDVTVRCSTMDCATVRGMESRLVINNHIKPGKNKQRIRIRCCRNISLGGGKVQDWLMLKGENPLH